MPVMTNPSVSLSIRIDKSIDDLLEKIADEHGLTVALLIEKLAVDEAATLSAFFPRYDPRGALVALVDDLQL